MCGEWCYKSLWLLRKVILRTIWALCRNCCGKWDSPIAPPDVLTVVQCIHADLSSKDVINDIHDALFMLQHRGQDAAGAAVCGRGGRIFSCKGQMLSTK